MNLGRSISVPFKKEQTRCTECTKIFLLALQLGLFNQITLEQCPGLAVLLDSGEKVEELMKLSPEAILLRWVNHQLERAGVR